MESALKNRMKQFVIDGEAVILGVDGRSDFDALHSGKHNEEVQLYAFDMLAGDGDDMRQLPLSMRKANLARLARRTSPVPAVIPAPDATTDETVGVLASICGPVWVTPLNKKMAASPRLFCTVAPLRVTPVAASEAVLSPAPTV